MSLVYDVSAFSGAYSMTTWAGYSAQQKRAPAPVYHPPAPAHVIHAAAAPKPAAHQTAHPAAKTHAAAAPKPATHKAATQKVAHNAVPQQNRSAGHYNPGQLAF
jgi:hypothetical protein